MQPHDTTRRRQRKFSPEQEVEICALYQTPNEVGDCATAIELGIRYGCSDATIRDILKRHGITPRPNMPRQSLRMFDKETEIAICEYYWTRLDTGYYPSYKEVADAFDCSAAQIRNLLRRNGYKSRTNAETRDHRPCKPINQPDGPAPLCACGCGTPTQWISRESEWRKYAPGHYIGVERKIAQPYLKKFRPAQTHNKVVIQRKPTNEKLQRKIHPLFEVFGKDILIDLYVTKIHSAKEIAAMLVTNIRTVTRALAYHGIPQRTLSESLISRGSVSGANNPAWKGGVAKWDYAPDWKRLCKQIKDRDKWTCQLCGEQRKHWGHKLHVHHIDEDKTNNHPHNLISLCSGCHAPIHGKEEMRVKLSEIAVRNTNA